MAPMLTYAQFCPVAKAAEVFGDRWTPIIMRELCFGARAFGELLDAAPLPIGLSARGHPASVYE